MGALGARHLANRESQPTLASTMKGLTAQVMIESRHRADTRTLKKLLVALIVDVVARFWTWRTLRTLDKHRRCLDTFRSSLS